MAFSELDLLDLRRQGVAGDFVCGHDAGTLLEGVGFGGFDILAQDDECAQGHDFTILDFGYLGQVDGAFSILADIVIARRFVNGGLAAIGIGVDNLHADDKVALVDELETADFGEFRRNLYRVLAFNAFEFQAVAERCSLDGVFGILDGIRSVNE